MFRPVTITHPVVVNDGKPFEAYRAEVYRYGRAVHLSLRTEMYVKKNLRTIGFPTNGVFSYKDDHIHRCVSILQYQIAQALNPPIKVTQAVLDAMEKVSEAEFSLVLDDKPWRSPKIRRRTTTLFLNPHPENFCWYGYPNDDTYNAERIGKKDDDCIDSGYIQADCPLALQVLLGFTTEGVPKDE